MKKIIFTLIGISVLFISTNSNANNNINLKENKTFHQSFRHAKNIHRFEKENGIVEFDFLLKGKYVSAYYDQSGKLTETNFSIDFKELPEKTKNYIQSEFSSACITDITKVNCSQTVVYKIKLESKGIEYSILSSPSGGITLGY